MVVTVPPGAEEAPNAVFLVPNDRWDLPAGLRVHATAPSLPPITAETRVETIQPGPQRNILVSAGSKGWSFLVDTANTPERSGVEVSGFHADAEEQLRELGYLDE